MIRSSNMTKVKITRKEIIKKRQEREMTSKSEQETKSEQTW